MVYNNKFSYFFYFNITDDLLMKNHPFQIQKKVIEKGEKKEKEHRINPLLLLALFVLMSI